MKIITDEKKIDELLSRSVVEILPSKEQLKKALMSGKPLRIYIGADATGPALHLGHATNYMILEKFRQLGHKVIILIGDFTARIGDPTDKLAARVQLTRAQVIKNTKTWLKQLKPIIDIKNWQNPVDIVYNNDWLSKMTFENVVNLASNFTVQQMLERDMFEKRMKENKPIYVHEFFYPLMQGYDSVYLNVDMEMCGNDQKFNALIGRTLLRRYKDKEKFVFITTLLENPVTGEKMMSKSLGTGLFLDMSPDEMFGKIMAQPDENIPQLFVDCTYVSLEEIAKIRRQLADANVNPRDLKMRLAREIVTMYHGEKAATKATEAWHQIHQAGQMPTDMKTHKASKREMPVIDLLVESGLCASKGEARRLVEQKGIRINEQEVAQVNEMVKIDKPIVVQKGKNTFIKVV